MSEPYSERNPHPWEDPFNYERTYDGPMLPHAGGIHPEDFTHYADYQRALLHDAIWQPEEFGAPYPQGSYAAPAQAPAQQEKAKSPAWTTDEYAGWSLGVLQSAKDVAETLQGVKPPEISISVWESTETATDKIEGKPRRHLLSVLRKHLFPMKDVLQGWCVASDTHPRAWIEDYQAFGVMLSEDGQLLPFWNDTMYTEPYTGHLYGPEVKIDGYLREWPRDPATNLPAMWFSRGTDPLANVTTVVCNTGTDRDQSLEAPEYKKGLSFLPEIGEPNRIYLHDVAYGLQALPDRPPKK